MLASAWIAPLVIAAFLPETAGRELEEIAPAPELLQSTIESATEAIADGKPLNPETPRPGKGGSGKGQGGGRGGGKRK